MAQSLREDGDPIERAYADFIEGYVPSYAKLWAEVIGNDGSSRLPLRTRFSDKLNERRQFTSQFAYTAVLAAIGAHRLAERGSKAKTLSDYLDSVDKLVTFYAHVGRIRDCVDHLGQLWGRADLANQLQEFYQRRNSVLHDALPPAAELYDVLHVTPPEGVEPDHHKWGKGRKWSDSNDFDFEPLDEYLHKTLLEALKLLNDAFARLHGHVCENARDLVLELRALKPLSEGTTIPSGSAGPGMIFGDIDIDSVEFDNPES